MENAVGSLKGVTSVDVDLTKQTVTVEYDPGTVNVKDVEEAIREEGYEVVGRE